MYDGKKQIFCAKFQDGLILAIEA